MFMPHQKKINSPDLHLVSLTELFNVSGHKIIVFPAVTYSDEVYEDISTGWGEG